MARTAGLLAYLSEDFDVQVAEIEGGTRLEVTKGDWWAKFDVHRDYVVWLSLKGSWLKEAHELARGFAQFGIVYLIADPWNAKAEAKLKEQGPWKRVEVNGRSKLRWDL